MLGGESHLEEEPRIVNKTPLNLSVPVKIAPSPKLTTMVSPMSQDTARTENFIVPYGIGKEERKQLKPKVKPSPKQRSA